MAFVYPEAVADRDRWILAHRPARAALSEQEPNGYFNEEECGADGQAEQVATILLTNRECPFHCAMCDLWRNTLTETVSSGAIPTQIEHALQRLSPARTVKLYNSGSFFDPGAIPPSDYATIAAQLREYDRVIVESHPTFVGERSVAFRDLLTGQLEVAMGLETAHPDVLEKLNKRMTLDQYASAAGFLRMQDIDLRAFILVQPPFMKVEDSLHWARQSLDFAFDCHAKAATLIPTRGGNGTMEVLAQVGSFVAPDLRMLEDAVAYGVGLHRGRVFADLWDLKQGGHCAHCFDTRMERLREINLRQTLLPALHCDICTCERQESH